MKVDEMVSLANGKSYGLLLESILNNTNYFLAVLLNNNEEPTDQYTVLKEITKNNEIFVLEEKNPVILNQLLTDYSLQMEDED